MNSVSAIASDLRAHGVAFAPEIAAAASRNGMDPELLAAVAAQETGGPDTDAGSNIVGDGGHGHGLFQIDDRFHAFARSPAAMDPSQNADYAAKMLHGLLVRYGGDAHEALSAYNAGRPDAEGTETRWGDGRQLGYADSVMRHYQRITGSPTSTPAGVGPVGQPASSSASSFDAILAEAQAENSATAASMNALFSAYQAHATRCSSPPEDHSSVADLIAGDDADNDN